MSKEQKPIVDIVPNSLKEAQNNLGQLVQVAKLPKTIKSSEKGFYHVVFIEAYLPQGAVMAKHRVKHQMFDPKAWITVSKRLAQVQSGKVFVYHNPTKPVLEEEAQEGGATVETLKSSNKTEEGAATQEATPQAQKEDSNTKAQSYRKELKARAKELGYDGGMNVKNEILKEFIKNAQENGEKEENK